MGISILKFPIKVAILLRTDFFRNIHPPQYLIEIEKILTLYYFEFSKDYRYTGEKHDFWEFVYVDKGKLEVSADQEGYELKEGDIILIAGKGRDNYMAIEDKYIPYSDYEVVENYFKNNN